MILIDRILFDTDLFVYSFSKDHTSPVGLPTNPCFPVQHDVAGVWRRRVTHRRRKRFCVSGARQLHAHVFGQCKSHPTPEAFKGVGMCSAFCHPVRTGNLDICDE